jgi:thioredoxin 1
MERENALSLTVTSDNFESTVLQSRKPVLVDFWAAWCGPCRAIAPIIENLALDYGDQLTVAKVDADTNSELLEEYRIRSIPTVMLIADGEIRQILVGARSAQEYRAGIDALLH